MDINEGSKPSITPGPGNQAPNDQSSDAKRAGDPPFGSGETESEQPAGFFSPGNIVMLGLIAALIGFLLYKFNPLELWWIVKAGVALSFVIFIHELGHFLAAKWCNVNVTTFSIGFGPPIPGLHYTWGETTYKIGILPLGGYVQMVGQVDGDESSDGSEEDPRSYRRKTVGQRMLIISAGVIMNAILAVICFIYVYLGPGKEHPAAVINSIDSARPVFTEGVRTSAEIERIGDIDNPTFTDLRQTVIFSSKGQSIDMIFRVPGQPLQSIQIESQKDKNEKVRAIGVSAPPKPQLASKRDADEGPFHADTPAQKAGFEHDDVILAMTDPLHPKQQEAYDPTLLKDLADDPRLPGVGQGDYFDFIQRMQVLADKEVVVRVRRWTNPETKQTREIDLKVAPMFRLKSAATMEMGPVLNVRKKSPAAVAGIRGPVQSNGAKLDGDLIEAVTIMEGDKKIVFQGKDLDPERLPFELRQWSARLDRANSKQARLVKIKWRRHVDRPGLQFETKEEDLKWDNTWQFDRVAPLSANSPMPIPELGLAFQIKATVAKVLDKNSGLEEGDVIKNVRVDYAGIKEDIKTKWAKHDIEEGQWANISHDLYAQPLRVKTVMLKVERTVVDANKKAEKTIVELELPVAYDTSWPLVDRGWRLAPDTRLVIATGPINAVHHGLYDTQCRMLEVFYTIRGIITGDIDSSVIGGPLSIAYGTYRFASMPFGDLVFFIGLISINLAVVNFLPIPILDGGHMVFLIYEKLRGRPASEGVRIWATYAGLAMIGCLMLFVIYQDVMRFFFS